MKRAARVFEELVLVLATVSLISLVGTSGLALGLKIVAITILGIVGIWFLARDSEEGDDDNDSLKFV
jgi:hypothetical protein